MAIAFISQRGAGTSAAAGSSFAVNLANGSNITVGNTLLMTVAARDTATPPIDGNGKFRVGSELCTDLRGNLWRLIATSSNEGATAGADDGATAYLWMCHVVFPYQNGDNIVVNATINSRPITHIAARIVEFNGILRASRVLNQGGNTGNGTAVQVTGASPDAAGQLVYAVAAVASNPTLTGDADATNGSWVAIDQATSGASGIRRGEQYKLVTAAGAQTWDVTWTGTQRWAAVAVSLQEAVYAWPYDLAPLANPNYPCPAGPEILPLDVTDVAVDTGTGYIFEIATPPESIGVSSMYWSSNANPPRLDVDTQHGICCEVYERGLELERNEPFIFTVGTPDMVTPSGGVTVGGGGTEVEALAAPGGSYLLIPAGDDVDLFWDTSALAAVQDDYRVLNARISYVAWKDNSAAAEPGEGIVVAWQDSTAYRAVAASSATRTYGAWLVNEYQPNARYATKNLGEVNGYPRFGAGGGGEMIDNLQACWTIRDFLHMASGDRSAWLRLRTLSGSHPSQQQIYLDTIRLDLFLVRETRLAQSVRRVSTGVGFPNGSEVLGGPGDTPLFEATDTSMPWATPTTSAELSVVLREPIPASGSDWYSAQTDPENITSQEGDIRYSSMEQVGPSVVLFGIVQPRDTLTPVPSVSRVAWSVGQIASDSTPEPFGEIVQSATLLNANSYHSWWPYYRVDNFLGSGPSSTVTVQQDIGVDGATSYDYLKVLVRPSVNTTDNLDFTVEQPTSTILAVASVTLADVMAQPDLGNGYREMLIPLSTTITPAAGTVEVYALSSTPDASPWVIGNAQATSERTTYTDDPTSQDLDGTDWAVALCCPLPDVEVSIASEEISTNDSGTDCADVSSTIPCLTVENAENYDWIAIERYVSLIDRTPLGVIAGGAGQGESLLVQDTFERIAASGWGTSDTGQAWTVEDGTAANFSVDGTRGLIAPNATLDLHTIRLEPAGTSDDPTLEATLDIDATPTGGTVTGFVSIRLTESPLDSYYLQVTWATNGQVSALLVKELSATPTTLATLPTILNYAPGDGLNVRLQAIGTEIRASMWVGDTDPGVWQVSVSDSDIASGDHISVDFRRGSGSSAVTMYTDNVMLYEHLPVTVEFCDYGVPWDIPSGELSYTVYGFRDTDRRRTPGESVAWNDVSENPGAAFGLATNDALYVYVPVSDGGDLEVEWNPLNPIEYMPLAGKDYQIALRVPEDRGLSVTVSVVANKLVRCDPINYAIYDESTYDEGFVYA